MESHFMNTWAHDHKGLNPSEAWWVSS